MITLISLVALAFIGYIQDPIVLAKQHMAQGKYDQALSVLSLSQDDKRYYFQGYCHYKLEDCSSCTFYLNEFVAIFEGNDKWIIEAQHLIERCGGNQDRLSMREVPEDTKENPGLREDYINSLLAESEEEEIDKIFNRSDIDRFKMTDDELEELMEDYILSVVSEDPMIEDPELSVQTKTDDNEPMVENILKKTDDNEPLVENAIPIDEDEHTNKTDDNEPMTENLMVMEEEEITRKKDDNEPMTENVLLIEDNDNTIKVDDNEPMTENLIPVKEEEMANRTDDNEPMTENVITAQDNRHHYKILFAASADGDQSFLSLSDLGPIISEQDDIGVYFYYLGNYEDREEAIAKARKVRQKGYGEATIMEFKEGKMVDEFEPLAEEVEEAEEEFKEVEVEEIVPLIQEVVKQDVITYHILFRVLDNPFEKFPELAEIGPLYRETYDKKGNSRYLVGETRSLKEAKKLLQKVKKKGYPSSFVVEYVNGEMKGLVE